MTVDEASTEGYGGTLDGDPTLPPGFGSNPREELSADEQIAYDEAFWGPDQQGGCLASAGDAITGDATDVNNMLNQLQGSAFAVEASMQAHPRVRELEADWSKCMADSGYDFSGEYEAIQAVAEEFGAGMNGGYSVGEYSPSAGEVAIATTDAACQAEVGLQEVELIRADIDTAFASDMRSVIDKWYEVRPAILTEVTALLGEKRVQEYLGEEAEVQPTGN